MSTEIQPARPVASGHLLHGTIPPWNAEHSHPMKPTISCLNVSSTCCATKPSAEIILSSALTRDKLLLCASVSLTKSRGCFYFNHTISIRTHTAIQYSTMFTELFCSVARAFNQSTCFSQSERSTDTDRVVTPIITHNITDHGHIDATLYGYLV